MTEESQQIPPLQDNLPVLPQSDALSGQPQKSRKKTWIILGCVIGFLVICAIICSVIFGAGMFKIFTEKAPIESVLTTYMQHMKSKDGESAYNLFSPRAQRQFSISGLNEMLEGNNYSLFDGFQSLSATNLNISVTVNPDDDLPQGTVAQVSGTISYDGGFQGSFDSTLEKVGEKWMIHNINVSIPPNKIK